MPRLVACAQGHQWHEADEAVSTAALRCPTCGAPALFDVQEAGVRELLETTPTLLHSMSWQPAAPGQVTDAASLPNLPDFEVLEEIGRGGMGIVYKARRHGEAAPRAVKVIRKDRLQHEESVRRFRREAQAAARLKHPNIVHVFGSDHGGDVHYLEMEYVEGVTLERLVELQGPLPVAQACDTIRQAALGLQHAHEQGLVHRDIKPSNLMITPPSAAEQTSQVKVLDMGVARVLQVGGKAEGESLSTLTQGGAVIGTADYIAPEQLEDAHGADVRADLYSLGCTFYFLLTGRVPFPAGSLIAKLDAQRWQSPAAIAATRADVPPAVAAVVARLMAKAPAERYQTPGELVQVLEALAETNYRGPVVPALVLRERARFTGHTDQVLCVRAAPDGQHCASAGKEGAVHVWNVARGQIVRSLPRQPQEVRALAYAPRGDRLATASGLTVRLWDTATGREVRRLSGHTGAVKTLLYCAEGAWLVSGSEDRTVRVWDAQLGHEIFRLTRHQGGITCLALLPATNQLLTGSRDQTLRLWELRNGQETRVMNASGGAVLDVAASPDGRFAITSHYDTTLRRWDVRSGEIVGLFEGHKQMAPAVALTLDGRRLVSASSDQTIRLWDVERGSELASLAGPIGGVNALSLAVDGGSVLTAGVDKTIGLIELPT